MNWIFVCSLDEFRYLTQFFLTRVPREFMDRINKFYTPIKVPNISLNIAGIFTPLLVIMDWSLSAIVRLKCDGTRAETRFRLSPKRTSPFKSAGLSVQSTTGSRGVRISISNAGYTTFRSSTRVLATNSIRQFPLHFPSRALPCAIMFRTSSLRRGRSEVHRNSHKSVYQSPSVKR